jgi:uncharacterized protein YjbJ (UPF0337 family)
MVQHRRGRYPMTKTRGGDAVHDMKEEFREKGGEAVGNKESVVEGHLDDMAGTTQDAYNGDKPAGTVRDKIEDTARREEEK